jgi:hypothetical protein
MLQDHFLITGTLTTVNAALLGISGLLPVVSGSLQAGTRVLQSGFWSLLPCNDPLQRGYRLIVWLQHRIVGRNLVVTGCNYRITVGTLIVTLGYEVMSACNNLVTRGYWVVAPKPPGNDLFQPAVT